MFVPYTSGPYTLKDDSRLSPHGEASIAFMLYAPSTRDDGYLAYIDMGSVDVHRDQSLAKELAATAQVLAASHDLLQVCEGILMYEDTRTHIQNRFPGLIKQIEEAVAKARTQE